MRTRNNINIKYLTKTLFFLILISLCHSYPFARPVSYPDAWTVINSIAPQTSNDLWVHYTLNAKESLGVDISYFPRYGTGKYATKYTGLLKRWNKLESQSNIYSSVSSGLGTRGDKNYFFLGNEWRMDWENRKFLIASSFLFYSFYDLFNYWSGTLRLGLALNRVNYEQIHAWFILALRRQESSLYANIQEIDPFGLNNEGAWSWHPIIRFYRLSYLIEIGLTFISRHLDGAHFKWILRL